MNLQMTTRSLGCLTLAVAAAACDPHQAPDYQGEALATLRGEVRLEREAPLPSDKIEVFYQNYTDYVAPEPPAEDFVRFAIVETVTVTGDYPASFTLDLFEPPPVEALTDFTVDGNPDERRVGLAVIASSYDCNEVVRAGARCIFGGAGRFALVWAEDDVVADTRTAAFLGTTLTAGYHLLEYIPNFASYDELAACDAAQGEVVPPGACAQYSLVGEVPLDTPLSVRLIEGFDMVFGNFGGASVPINGLELPHWFDALDFIE